MSEGPANVCFYGNSYFLDSLESDRGRCNVGISTEVTLVDIDPDQGYSSSYDNLLKDFYAPCLSSSTRYDRSAGYFSSALISLAPLAYAEFVARGGKIRMVCSPYVSAEDSERLTSDGSVPSIDKVISELVALRESSDLNRSLTTVMSSLIAAGILEIKFARPKAGTGLFHDKVGIFTDVQLNQVSFVGSANETAAAWSGYGNHEQIEVFCSWKSSEQSGRISRHRQHFDELWAGVVRGLEVTSANAASAIIRGLAPSRDVAEALDDFRVAFEMRQLNSRSHTSTRPLMDHQEKVLKNWEIAGNRGIIVFATGGGKTLAAIEAIKRWTSDGGKPALVLVPSELLHEQWEKELRHELPDALILKAGAGARKEDWMRTLSFASKKNQEHAQHIILSTYQTASTRDFLNRLSQGEDLLIVADEVHRMGAPDCERLFSIEAGGRLGLSATPERFGDSVGTERIFNFFGDSLEPRFELADAIQAGRLVPYDYYLETIELEPEELEEWDVLSKELGKAIAQSEEGTFSDRAKWFAMQRARIIKSANRKTILARDVIRKRWRPGDRWLIYCDDRVHLNEVRAAVEPLGHPTFEYHSGNSHLSDEILGQFLQGGILLAIKCLDEGVDLPLINKALILASTTNPREYIQRRGRVLRKTEGKYSATVIDVIVTDQDGVPLSLSEVKRAQEFAGLAQNNSGFLLLHKLEVKAGMHPQMGLDLAIIESDAGGAND